MINRSESELKQVIAENFSKHSQTYNEYASVQENTAKNLIHYVKNNLSLVDGNILELGCGTGYLSKLFVESFPARQIQITDLSSGMLEQCQKQVKNQDNVTFSIRDGENITTENEYALIISGFTFQWFFHFQKSILNLVNALKKGGVLLFSIQEAGSFIEWEEYCKKLELPYSANQLPNVDSLSNLFSDEIELHTWHEQKKLCFPSAKAFFQSLKGIGANTHTTSKVLTTKQMRNLIQTWNQDSPNGIEVTYQVGYACISKS